MNERLKAIRENLKMSRAEFGEKLGISGDVVNNLERGRVEIKEDRIKLICSIFAINEKWLRTGEGEMYEDSDIDFAEICLKIGIKDEKAKQAIIDYWNLSENDKNLFWNFYERFLK